jgi:hypothetical protein
MSLDKLSGYPCREYGRCGAKCVEREEDICKRIGIYRAHIALRRAVLGDMTAEMAVLMYRNIAERHGRFSVARRHFFALATVVEGMET